MTIINTFEANEAAGLEGLDADLQAVAKTSPQRAVAILMAQAADLAGSDEGRAAREAARMAAIEADAALRTGLKGRPPISDERTAYRALCEAHDEAPDCFSLAMDRYTKVIEQLKQAGPALDALQAHADAQAKRCQEVVGHLKAAAELFAQATTMADGGKAVMSQLSGLVAFAADPFVDLAAAPRELADLHKRWALRLDAELARLGKDDESELVAQRERQATAAYKAKFDKAAAAFRKTPDGKRLWADYSQVAKVYATAQTERPGEGLGDIRDQCNRQLERFQKAAAVHGGMAFHAESVPQVA